MPSRDTSLSRTNSPAPAAPTTPTATKKAKETYFPALDGLRAAAFLAVFCHHYGVIPYGWVGVDFFFVLSGFLITGILLDTIDDPHRVRNFYLRRTLRIFPLYYAVFLILLLLAPAVHWQWNAHWLLWTAYFTNDLGLIHRYPLDTATFNLINGLLFSRLNFVFYVGHFWSLCVEEQFYLVWPWIVFWVRSRRALLWICAAIMLFCPLLRVYTLEYHPQRVLGTFLLLRGTPFRIDSLLFGAATALLYRGQHRNSLLKVARPFAWLAGALALIALHAPSFWRTESFGNFVQTWGFSCVALLSAAVILRALLPESRLYPIFSNAPLRWLGGISYGAYVFHDIPHTLYGHLAHTHRSLTALIALPCTLLLATLSYRFLEAPCLRLKARWTV